MAKGGVNRYKVDIQGLSFDTHEFSFEFDSSFFGRFENSPVEKGSLEAHLELDKSERLISASIKVEGSVELECDRSLDLFDYPIQLEREIIFKFGQEYEELDDDVIQIPVDTDRIDFAELIYQFIILEIPMKKIHPRYSGDEDDGDTVFYTTGETESEEEINQESDPRWSALKNLKKKNK